MKNTRYLTHVQNSEIGKILFRQRVQVTSDFLTIAYVLQVHERLVEIRCNPNDQTTQYALK